MRSSKCLYCWIKSSCIECHTTWNVYKQTWLSLDLPLSISLSHGIRLFIFVSFIPRCAFYRPWTNLFCSKWRNSVHGVTHRQFKKITQLTIASLVARQVWTWVVKRTTSHSIRFAAMLKKEVARFCCSFYSSLTGFHCKQKIIYLLAQLQ